MAVYSNLLLSEGGGIIFPQQQGEQVKNTATILIGLGGTGLDCLKAIKATVKERLRPDDPEAKVPEYSWTTNLNGFRRMRMLLPRW